jgi:hypothetical protein
MMLHDAGSASLLDRPSLSQEDNMADDSGQDDGALPVSTALASIAPEGARGPNADDTGPDSPGGESPARRLRSRPNFRGHIVIDDGEPLPVFDAPADPPPVPPAPADSQMSPD